MDLSRPSLETLHEIHNKLVTMGYRITGLTSVNLYGYGITTNVFDIAVESDEAVIETAKILKLPVPNLEQVDPYLYNNSEMFIRIQGDILGEPTIHPLGFHLQSKELLIRRLEIYSNYDPRILKALAFIALTVTDEMAYKYKHYWNRL